MAGTTVVEKFLDAIASATIPACDAWSADATLDATVPNWRLHARGADAIRAEYARWFADPARFEEIHRHSADGGAGAGEAVEVRRVHAELVGERGAARGPPRAPADGAR